MGAATALTEVWFPHPSDAWASGEVINKDADNNKFTVRPHSAFSGETTRSRDGADLTVDSAKCVKYDSTHVEPLQDIAKVKVAS